ncbi:hypothetical protein G1K75_09570 [Tenacibaculum finnmarkense]|uniref:hypothetical protein n=1 Tax=Tenacibaculum finnmarkense TaxID=2781243 RepID=UPI001E40CFAD|nr:hypothetical protein [Tenacibaculum finnmarkense]MCD8425562.1 hypothetical protein [Tenacibaculum dicentrarchi]MCG8805903.1 hypothetical protein [Tenacibaculum finnmarkense]MCG8838589.1 hypothetical protein [Tenacibaculum dicentrarchi]
MEHVNFLVNQEPYLRVTEYLGYKKSTSEEYRREWTVGKMKPTPAELYINRKITPGSTVNLLEGIQLDIKGQCNYNDGRKLTPGRVFVASELAFGWVIADKDSNPALLKYNYSELNPYLSNVTLHNRQGEETLIDMPLSMIVSNGELHGIYKELGAFVLFDDKHQIEAQLRFPEGDYTSMIPDGKALFISQRIAGMQTITQR